MSKKHPIVAITGSSGAGTSTVLHSFRHIFRREKIRVQIIHGDSFHRFTRDEMNQAMRAAEKRGNKNFSHFGPAANLLDELESLFQSYAKTGTGKLAFNDSIKKSPSSFSTICPRSTVKYCLVCASKYLVCPPKL